MTGDLSKPKNLPDFKDLKLDFDLIDSHHHLFDLDAVYYPWLCDRPESGFLLGDYKAIKKNYLPEDYLLDADDLRPLKTVHVEAEADHAHPLAETQWLEKVMKKHPILKGMPDDWKTPKDELYVVEKLWPNAKALATSVSERNKKEHAVIWTHQYGKARVFGTTYGHSDATFRDPVFLNYVSRGLLWAAARLETNK